MTSLNTTMNGTHPPNCSNPTIERVGKTVAYCLILVVSLIGNIFIGIIVYETKTMRSPSTSSSQTRPCPICCSRLCATWIATLAARSRVLFYQRVVKSKPMSKLDCLQRQNEAFGQFSSFKYYYLSVCIILLYFPLVFMTIIYTIIVSNLRCHKIRGKQSDSLRKKMSEGRATWIEDVHCYRACVRCMFRA